MNDFLDTDIMKFLTDEKLVIVGAGGMIGSNMVQSVLMLGLGTLTHHFDNFSKNI